MTKARYVLGIVGLIVFLSVVTAPVQAQEQQDTQNEQSAIPQNIQDLIEQNPEQATDGQITTVEKWFFENRDSLSKEDSKTVNEWLTTARDLPPSEDKDGDGVINRMDLCDDQTGPPENNGCPVFTGDIVNQGSDIQREDITLFDVNEENQPETILREVGKLQVLDSEWKKDSVILRLRVVEGYDQPIPVTLTPQIQVDSGFKAPDQARITVPPNKIVKVEVNAPPQGLNDDQAVSIGTPRDFVIYSDPDEPLIGNGKIPIREAGIGIFLFLVGIISRVGYLVYTKNETGDPKSLSGMKIRNKRVGIFNSRGDDDE